MSDYIGLPEGLPVPTDDGQADHLLGMSLPSLNLMGTAGSQVHMNAFHNERTIIYVYPMTGRPGVDLPTGWDEIPGARGCTPESCGFRDHFGALQSLGVAHVYGLSSQDTDYQIEAAKRLNLPFELLSDSNQELVKRWAYQHLRQMEESFTSDLQWLSSEAELKKSSTPYFLQISTPKKF